MHSVSSIRKYSFFESFFHQFIGANVAGTCLKQNTGVERQPPTPPTSSPSLPLSTPRSSNPTPTPRRKIKKSLCNTLVRPYPRRPVPGPRRDEASDVRDRDRDDCTGKTRVRKMTGRRGRGGGRTRVLVPLEHELGPRSVGVPELDAAILGAGNDPRAVGRDGDREDVVLRPPSISFPPPTERERR